MRLEKAQRIIRLDFSRRVPAVIVRDANKSNDRFFVDVKQGGYLGDAVTRKNPGYDLASPSPAGAEGRPHRCDAPP